MMSLLSWERGLKYVDLHHAHPVYRSLLSWERGLKYYKRAIKIIDMFVAPLVGAWIEIL